MELKRGKTFNIEISNGIKQIKLAMSFNDKFFVCFSKIENPSPPTCLINNYKYEFEEVGCKIDRNWSDEYKVFYFNETDDFMLLSKGYCTSIVLNNLDNKIKICGDNIFSFQEKNYYIIYINGYQVVNYNNFSNFAQITEISIVENNTDIFKLKLNI